MEKNIEDMNLEELKVYEVKLLGEVPRDVVGLNRVQDRITQLEAEHEQQAAQQVRIQAQEEKVATITLPYNFNDIFSDEEYKNAQGQPHKITVANDMFIELAQDLQRKAYDSHNVEIQTLLDAHKEELRLAKEEIRASAERELQLKRQNTELQGENTALSLHSSELGGMLEAEKVAHSETKLRVNEIETNRSNAVKQLEEAHAEITQLKQWNDDLRAQAAHGVRKAIDIIDISPSEKLAAMVKETTEQKANRALTRWSEIMPEIVAPPVPAGLAAFHTDQADVSTHPVDQTQPIPIPADHTEVAGHTFQVPSGVQVDGNAAVPEVHAKAVTQEQINVIHARLERLEKQANLPYQVAV